MLEALSDILHARSNSKIKPDKGNNCQKWAYEIINF